jgi:hypothetical protein
MKENITFACSVLAIRNIIRCLKVSGKYPKKMGLHLGFSEELAHQIEASDITMPSKFEFQV